MKSVFRQTLLINKTRRENDAEHSWHFAVAAMVLAEYAADDRVDISRVIRMALVHDLVEIYAGDTFAYDEQGYSDKLAREEAAADRLFGLLPEDQGKEYRALWEEFDRMETPDSLYAASIDRLQPLLNNYMTGGHTWQISGVNSQKVYARLAVVQKAAPALYAFLDELLKDAVSRGMLRP